MDEVIWVEVLSRHKGVQSRQRCEGRGVRIGRAYTNDVILDDPYVAPEHVHIVRGEDGRLIVEDLGTANGLFAAHGKRRLDRLALDDDAIFRIGHSFIRVRQTEHRVAPERVFGREGQALASIGALAALVLGIAGASVWLTDFTEPNAATYVLPLLGGSVLIVLWAALWSFAARIFAGHGNFERNLIIALAGVLGLEAVGAAGVVGAFGFSWSALQSHTYVGYFAVLAGMSFAHLREINPGRQAIAGAVMAMLLVAAVVVQSLVDSEDHRGGANGFDRTLLPPALRLAPVASESSFFSTVEKLRSEIDADRSQAP
jgi:hypothetical protein